MRPLTFLYLLMFFYAPSERAQFVPTETTVCALTGAPQSFNGKVVRVHGAITLLFENFTLHSKDCVPKTNIWLAFGGDVATPTDSTVNDNSRKPGAHVRIGGKEYSLEKNDTFRRFYSLLTAIRGDGPAYKVNATLTGEFISVRKAAEDMPGIGGYGHLGCCDLFVITEVTDVESDPPANLKIGGVVVSPNGNPISGVKVTSETLGCCQPQQEVVVTDGSGRFQFSYGGQMLHFRNDTLQPVSVFVEDPKTDIRVTLADSRQTDWTIGICPRAKMPKRWVGYGYKFFAGQAATKHMRNTKEGYDFYTVESHHEQENLTISDGVNNSINEILASSPTFQERWIKDSAGAAIGIDLRGLEAIGYHWRRVLFSSYEGASYGVKSVEDAELLDRVLDSACMAKH